MDAVSPVYAAFGFIEHDALNDLAHWLDGRAEPLPMDAGVERAGGGDGAGRSALREG